MILQKYPRFIIDRGGVGFSKWNCIFIRHCISIVLNNLYCISFKQLKRTISSRGKAKKQEDRPKV